MVCHTTDIVLELIKNRGYIEISEIVVFECGTNESLLLIKKQWLRFVKAIYINNKDDQLVHFDLDFCNQQGS